MIQWIIIIALLLIAAALAYVLERKFDEAGRERRDNENLRREREQTRRAHEEAQAAAAEELAAAVEAQSAAERAHSISSNARAKQAKELRELLRARAVAWPKPERRMTEREVLGQFDVEMGDPFWTAIHQELDDAIGDQLDLVTQAPAASLTAEQRVHIAGMAEGLRTFQRRLLDRQAAATRAEADDDGDDEKAA